MPVSIPNAGDPVVWAVVTSDADGEADWAGQQSVTVNWLVCCDRPDALPPQLLAGGKLPRRGEPLKRYRPTDGGYRENPDANPTYAGFDVISETLTVAGYTFRRRADEPLLWDVGVRYEQSGDPLAQAAEVSTEPIEYQSYENFDVFGRPVVNSVRDPFLGGMPVDRTMKALKITRSLPWEAWFVGKADEFENTLNLEPFTLSRQVDRRDGFDAAVVLPPGTVRLKRVSEQEVVRSPSPRAAGRKSYWRVTCELILDRRTLRQPDGTVVPLRHRWATADAGFRQLTPAGGVAPITQRGLPVHEMQLLDGKGRPIVPPNPPSRPKAPDGWEGAWPGRSADPLGEPDEYFTVMDEPLEVPAPGVLTNDGEDVDAADLDTPPEHGTVELRADGSFTYTPAAGYFGWDYFLYRPVRLSFPGARVTVFINVVETRLPRWLLFDRYEHKSWLPLSDLLVDW